MPPSTARQPLPTGAPSGAPVDVLFVEGSSGFGGSTVGLARLIAGLDPARFRPLVAVAHASQLEYLERLGLVGGAQDVPADVVPLPRMRHSLLPRVETALRTMGYVGRLKRFVASGSPVLVHGNNSVSINAGAIVLARLLRVPVVIKQRGFEWDSAKNRRLARTVDWFLPDSRAVCGALEGLGVSPDRMTVTYCTIDPNAYRLDESVSAVRSELGLPVAGPLLGIVGCIVDWKGQDVFLDAFARVAARHADARALVVGDTPTGRPDAYSRGLREQAKRLGIEDRVLFTGHRDDVPRMLHALDVCVHASTSPEPFGTVCAEAMATGRPVIAADDGGPPEYVRDGETGLLTPPRDSSALSDAIERLLDDPALAERLASAGRAEVLARFGIQRHARETEAIYQALLAARRRGGPAKPNPGPATG